MAVSIVATAIHRTYSYGVADVLLSPASSVFAYCLIQYSIASSTLISLESLCAGASPQTHAKNRHELYDISKSLEHAAKKQQQSAIGKQSKKCSLGKRKAHINVIKPAVDTGAVQSHIAQPQAEGSRKKHKAGKAAANGQTSGSVESPGGLTNCVACCQPRSSDST